MKDLEELKSEIDEISKKIDAIIENVAKVEPTPEEPESNQD